MQIKIINIYHLIPVIISIIKKTRIVSVGEDVEKREPICPVGGNKIGATIMENSMENPQKIKNRTKT